MENKNKFGLYSQPKEDHISLLRYSKSACGVDFLLNTAESSERESWFNLYSNYKTDFFEFFFFRKANGYVIVNGEKHHLTDNSLLIISPYQRQEWHVDIDRLDYTFLIFQEEFIYNFISDKQFMYRLLYCYQNEYPTCFKMPEQDIRNFTDTLCKIKQEPAQSYRRQLSYDCGCALRVSLAAQPILCRPVWPINAYAGK